MTVTSEPSICIPRTLNKFTWHEVKELFEQFFGHGTIDRVDIVVVRNDPTFCKIFIHFRYWPLDNESQAARAHLLGGGTIKVLYDFPKFWRCAASRTSKPERNMGKVVPYIELETKQVDYTDTTSEGDLGGGQGKGGAGAADATSV